MPPTHKTHPNTCPKKKCSQHCLKSNAILYLLICISLSNLFVTPLQADDKPTGKSPEQIVEIRWYRLESIAIPPRSPFRRSPSAPHLFVVYRLNGTKINSSTVRHGWEVIFERKNIKNHFAIPQDSADKIEIEVWDDGWLYDTLLFSCSDLTYKDFDSPISEKVSDLDWEPEKAAARIKFAEIKE